MLVTTCPNGRRLPITLRILYKLLQLLGKSCEKLHPEQCGNEAKKIRGKTLTEPVNILSNEASRIIGENPY
jgi:hypothetical protein